MKLSLLYEGEWGASWAGQQSGAPKSSDKTRQRPKVFGGGKRLMPQASTAPVKPLTRPKQQVKPQQSEPGPNDWVPNNPNAPKTKAKPDKWKPVTR